MTPDQTSIDELKALITDFDSLRSDTVVNSGKSIKLGVDIGARIAALKKEIGKDWHAFRDANLPEVLSIERGCVRLAKIKDRQPELFKDESKMILFGRLAGFLPPSGDRKAANPKPIVILIAAALKSAARLLSGYVPDEWGRKQLAACLKPVIEWVKINAPEALNVDGKEGI